MYIHQKKCIKVVNEIQLIVTNLMNNLHFVVNFVVNDILKLKKTPYLSAFSLLIRYSNSIVPGGLDVIS